MGRIPQKRSKFCYYCYDWDCIVWHFKRYLGKNCEGNRLKEFEPSVSLGNQDFKTVGDWQYLIQTSGENVQSLITAINV